MGKRDTLDFQNADLNEVLAVLAKENASRRSNRRALTWTLGGGVLVLILLMLASWLRTGNSPDWGTLVPMIALVGAGAAFTSTHRQALKRVSEIQTKESAGFLLEAYSTSDERDIKEVCLAALPGSLAKVDDPADLDPYQRDLLYKLLKTSCPQPLVDAVLDCCERIAGPEAIPALEGLQTSARKIKDPAWQRLETRTLEVLPTIRMRTAREIIDRHSQASHPESNEKLNQVNAG